MVPNSSVGKQQLEQQTRAHVHYSKE